MFSEITNSIKAILYERVVSPLSGILLLAWIAFNWRPIAVFCFGTEPVTWRITYIETHYIELNRNLIYPAITAVAITIVYPFLAFAAFALWEKVSSWKVELKQRFEGTVALPISKTIAIWTEIREKDKQFNIAIVAKDDRIAELEKANDVLSGELGNLKDSLKTGTSLEVEIAKRTEQLAMMERRMADEVNSRDVRIGELLEGVSSRDAEIRGLKNRLGKPVQRTRNIGDLQDEEVKILVDLGSAEEEDERISVDDLIARQKLTKVKGNYFIESLKSKGYIATSKTHSGEYLRLQQSARKVLVDLLNKGGKEGE